LQWQRTVSKSDDFRTPNPRFGVRKAKFIEESFASFRPYRLTEESMNDGKRWVLHKRDTVPE
jgi:hypothetical protein